MGTAHSHLTPSRAIFTISHRHGLRLAQDKNWLRSNLQALTAAHATDIIIAKVKIKHSSPYYPQGNARPEHLNSTLIEALRVCCANTSMHDWDRSLALFEMNYNASVKRSFRTSLRQELQDLASLCHPFQTLQRTWIPSEKPSKFTWKQLATPLTSSPG
eukprot:762799-Hanusia_phi.AAC.2